MNTNSNLLIIYVFIEIPKLHLIIAQKSLNTESKFKIYSFKVNLTLYEIEANLLF